MFDIRLVIRWEGSGEGKSAHSLYQFHLVRGTFLSLILSRLNSFVTVEDEVEAT